MPQLNIVMFFSQFLFLFLFSLVFLFFLEDVFFILVSQGRFKNYFLKKRHNAFKEYNQTLFLKLLFTKIKIK